MKSKERKDECLIALSNQGASQFVQEEEPAWLSGHESRWNPGSRLVSEGHPQTQSLPHHTAGKRPIGPTDNVVRSQEETGTNRIRKGRDMCRAALETGDGVLFNCEWMEFRANPMGICLPIINRVILTSKLWFPECDMAHATNSKGDCQFPSTLI